MNLRIENYRNLSNVEFEIFNNILVIVGGNSIGKTNVLDAINQDCYSLINQNHQYSERFMLSGDLVMSDSNSLICDETFKKLFNMTYHYNSEALSNDFYRVSDEIDLKLQSDFEYLSDNVKISPLDMSNVDKILQPYFQVDGNNVGLNIGVAQKRLAMFKMLKRLSVEQPDKKFILLVDEPELHAHPALIREFCLEMKKLAKLGHLIIITTHNEKVVEYATYDIRQVAKLSLVKSKVNVIQVQLDEYVKRVREFYNHPDLTVLPNGKRNTSLYSILESGLAQFCKTILRDKTFKMLFCDVLLIGEGTSEEIIFDHIFKSVESEFMYLNNVDYIVGFGKFYQPFYFILASLYNIKCVCMYDSDDITNRSHKAFHMAFQQYQIDHKSCKMLELNPNLEEVLGIVMPKNRVEKPLNIFDSLYKSKEDNILGLTQAIVSNITYLVKHLA